VSICFDPRQSEIVIDSPVMAKVADGGCAICGEEGTLMAFLPHATFLTIQINGSIGTGQCH
jgi:hypothetical protein